MDRDLPISYTSYELRLTTENTFQFRKAFVVLLVCVWRFNVLQRKSPYSPLPMYNVHYT